MSSRSKELYKIREDTIIMLQEKIDNLHNLAYRLLHIEYSGDYLHAEDFPSMNKVIHEEIDALYPQYGNTPEQEASLCLAILLGYAVSIYANPDDDQKRKAILNRSLQLLAVLSPSPLKQELLTVCREYTRV